MANIGSVYDKHQRMIKRVMSEEEDVKKAYRKVEKKLHLGKTYNSFYHYVVKKGLYTPKQPPKKEKREIPEKCKFPNCFQCIYKDCILDGRKAYMADSNELYELSKCLL